MKQVISQSIIRDEEKDLEIIISDHEDYPEEWVSIQLDKEVNGVIHKSLIPELISTLQKFR